MLDVTLDQGAVQVAVGRMSARLANWDFSSDELKVVGTTLLVLSICANVFVGIFLEQFHNKQWIIRLGAFAAALFTAILVAFQPMTVSYKYRDAWRILDDALLRYSVDKNDQAFTNVLDAAKRGEEIIATAPEPGTSTSSEPPPVHSPLGGTPKM
jgi:hypothetical protein